MPPLDGLELAQRHDGVGRGRSGEHRDERHIKDGAAGPQEHDGHVVRLRGRSKFVDDRLHDRVR